MAERIDKNVLIGKKAIIEYTGLSPDLYDKFRTKFKMPILIVDRRHYATRDNLDKYFNQITLCDSSKILDDGEDE